jgi:lysophospholipase L1-like esterase
LGDGFVFEGLGLVLLVLLADRPTLQDGDRVVMVGDTLIEREAREGWTEKALLLASPAKKLVFRNLGWSGDTPAGLSRAYFDPPEAGFQRLVDQIKVCRPTVIIVGYGMASLLDAIAVKEFMTEYRRLVDAIQPPPRHWVFMSPIPTTVKGRFKPQETLGQRLLAYSQEIGRLANERNATFINLLRPPIVTEGMLHPNGILPNEVGYRKIARRIVEVFEPESPVLSQDWPSATEDGSRESKSQTQLQEFDTLVRRKNSLYFERYRPQNITYLLGFRAYEQGQNAKEIEALDPAIAKLEEQIEGLRGELRLALSQEKKSP